MVYDVTEFIQTGRLGPLSLGCSQSEIERILGRSEEVIADADGTDLWFYGCVELGLHNGRVDGICILFDDQFPKFTPGLKVKHGSVDWPSIQPPEFTNWCRSQGISFSRSEGEDQRGFLLDVGTWVRFSQNVGSLFAAGRPVPNLRRHSLDWHG